VTTWPRKHKIKTPSQAFTRSKKIYGIRRGLKFCGTVHCHLTIISLIHWINIDHLLLCVIITDNWGTVHCDMAMCKVLVHFNIWVKDIYTVCTLNIHLFTFFLFLFCESLFVLSFTLVIRLPLYYNMYITMFFKMEIKS